MATREESTVTVASEAPQEDRASATVTRLVNTSRQTTLRTIDEERTPDTGARALPSGRPPRKPRVGLWTFALFVLIPVLVSVWYFGFFATDQYIAEARFAVRSLSTDTVQETSTVGSSSSLSASALTQDAYVVASFIHSPEILRRLNARADIRSFFASPSIDPFSRLPADVTSEQMMKYWAKQVTTYIDGPSGIITLYVRTFSPQTAQQLADMITQESEKLINELSERARVDIVARAQGEVEKTERNYRKVLSDVNIYQNASGILDPTAQAGETGALLLSLMSKKLEIDSRLFVVSKSMAEEAPSVQQLKRTQTSLQDQIDKLRAELANSRTAGDNLSNTLKRFSELETDRMLASGLYEAARQNLASAQTEAISKSVYVTVFVPPAVPEESRYPARVFTPLMILLGLTIGWAIMALAWASVEDHML